MTTHNKPSRDEPLEDLSSWQLKNDDQDIRGFNVYANPADIIGVVDELLVDKDAEVVSAIKLKSGETIPASEITIKDGAVYLKDMAVRTPFVKAYED